MSLDRRSATVADFPGIAELQARWETRWFGTVEESAAEVAERLHRIASLDDDTVLLFDDGRLVGGGVRWRVDTDVYLDPDVDPAPVYAELLPWYATRPAAHLEVLGRDDRVLGVLREAHWRHNGSTFELFGQTGTHFPAPEWPQGVELVDFDASRAAEVYRLIYVEAGWTKVPGHPPREYGEWRDLFVNDKVHPGLHVLACRADRLVGISLGRIWDDGTGWVSQLAVAEHERGRGLGRALLRESLARYVRSGATQVGLTVQAENRGALRMYLDAGLEIDREWMSFVPPG